MTTTEADWVIDTWQDIETKIFNTAKHCGDVSTPKQREEALRNHLYSEGFLTKHGALIIDKAKAFIAHCLQHYSHHVAYHYGMGRIALDYDTNPCGYPNTFDDTNWSDVTDVNDRLREDVFGDHWFGEEHVDIAEEQIPELFGQRPRRHTRQSLSFQPNWDTDRSGGEWQYLYAEDIHSCVLDSEGCIPDGWFHEFEEEDTGEDYYEQLGTAFVEDYYKLWGLYLFSVHWNFTTSEENFLYMLRWEMAKRYEDDITEAESLFDLSRRYPSVDTKAKWPWHWESADFAAESNNNCDIIPEYAKALKKLHAYALEGVADSYRDETGWTCRVEDTAIMRTDDFGKTWYQICPGDVSGVAQTAFVEIDEVFEIASKFEGLEAFQEFIKAVYRIKGIEGE